MDKREILRLNLKFGKFLDPLVIVVIITIISLSVLSIQNLSPQSFSKEQKQTVLGVESENQAKLQLIRGEHNYIHSEKLENVSPTYFTYSTFLKKPPKGRMSKPILQTSELQNEVELKVQLAYSNSSSSKISIFDKEKNTKYVLKEKNREYTQNIVLDENSKELYIVFENTKPIFFDQYIEINFFLNL